MPKPGFYSAAPHTRTPVSVGTNSPPLVSPLGRPLTRHDYPLPVWPRSSPHQVLRIGVIGFGVTRRLSYGGGKIPLKGYGTIARRCYIVHTIGRARRGHWPNRMSRSLTSGGASDAYNEDSPSKVASSSLSLAVPLAYNRLNVRRAWRLVQATDG
jgi:hypothetical protein